MKKFALLAAALVCFAGCAQNDTDDMGATETTSSRDTAIGTPSGSESGSAAGAMDTNLVLPQGPDRTDVVFDFFFADVSAAARARILESIAVSDMHMR